MEFGGRFRKSGCVHLLRWEVCSSCIVEPFWYRVGVPSGGASCQAPVPSTLVVELLGDRFA